MATLASSLVEDVPRLIKVEVVKEPSIEAKVKNFIISMPKPCCMDLIVEFLTENRLPNDVKEAERVQRVSARFWLFGDHRLHRRSFGGPFLLCLYPSKIDEILTELHEGVYSSHVGGRSLAHRAMTQGFWSPKMLKDVA